MKRTVLLCSSLFALAFGTVAYAQSLPEPAIHTSVQLMGFSTQTVTGGAGVLGMLDACHADFPASRLCSSLDILNTEQRFPITTTERAWVRPVAQPHNSDSSDSRFSNTVLDASGVAYPEADIMSSSMSCRGWATTTSTVLGLTVSPGGSFGPRSCDVARPVACCTLIQVPEPSSSLGLGAGVATLAALSQVKKATN